ncbi:hypothetical protein [Geodermatophilus sp. TF02-6]|uniref:hypothetical protein n=1 Tax=Geodermatophilus sp. TF02-6 TaxID=2250575 RepID=UPI001F29DDC6|nr:hypothetical protein [Geodermatophilus sp. TF02-6]
MPLYARSPALRARQLGADLGVLAWLVLWVLIARAVHGAVLVLAEPGRAVEDLGASVADSMSSAAGVAGDVPVVGDELAAPFRALGDAGSSVGGTGQAAQDAVGTLATALAVVLVVLPVGWLLLRWLSWRLGWARAAGAAGALATVDPDVLAARALATAPLSRLAALPPGTAAAWRAGDPTATAALAAVQLARLGLPVPEPPAHRSGASAPGGTDLRSAPGSR